MQLKENVNVSVIVTTYNRSKLLLETIRSIINQTFSNIELIIVDDGSTDDTEEVIKSVSDPRIEYIKIKNWGGPARPRNIGIKKAKGKFLAFCDDDDLWMTDKLETQLKHFEDSSIVGVGSSTLLFGNLRYYKQKLYNNNLELGFLDLLNIGTLALSSLVVRKIDNFFFDESRHLLFIEDFEFQLRLLNKTGKKFKLLADPLIYYRIHHNSSAIGIRNNLVSVVDKYRKDIPEKMYREVESKINFNFGINYLRKNDPERAKTYFHRAFVKSKMKYKIKAMIGLVLSFSPFFIRDKLMVLYYGTLNRNL